MEMKMKITESENLFTGSPGTIKNISTDYILLNDFSGADVIDLLNKSSSIEADKLLLFIDHECPAGTIEAAEKQKKLIDFACAHNLPISQCGNSYSIILNRESFRSSSIACLGKHCRILGAAGITAFHVNQAEALALITGATVSRTVPETITIGFYGNLKPGVMLRDVLFNMIRDGIGNAVQEKLMIITGNLSPQQRMEACLFSTELGAEYALFREDAHPDLIINLNEYSPCVVLPGNYETIVPASTVSGSKIDEVSIGGCLHGDIASLRYIADMVKGRKIADEVRFTVAPASSEVLIQAMNEGIVSTLLDSGIHMGCPGCGACKATAFGYVEKGEVLLSTGPFNYEGCAGNKESKVYLSSLATAVASALAGHITSPEA